MKTIIKILGTFILILMFLAGIIMLVTETPENASTMEIIAINGGGVALFSTSLLILSKIYGDSDDEEYVQKGGKYYGVR